MLDNFQLAAIVKQGGRTQLFRIPLHQDLQKSLTISWGLQYKNFVTEIDEIDFDAGYKPEDHERFRLPSFELPEWLEGENSQSVDKLDEINRDDATLENARGLAAFARINEAEIILFQNFSRAHVIQPGHFLFLKNNTYESTSRPGLALDHRLSAVYTPSSQTLLFHNFRTVNTFLPLADFYEEATEQQIREILEHNLLAPEDVDSLATGANQWFRKRFAMLRDSRVLDTYTAAQIQKRSAGYEVTVRIEDGKIVFPAEKREAKRLLQFLNEEIFRGAITKTLYETNSKREADT